MSYEKYEKELLDELKEMPGLEERQRETVRRAVESYFNQREGRLENLLERLEPGKDPKHRDWLDKAKAASQLAYDEFEKVRDVPVAAKDFLSRIAFQENRLFFLLAMSQMPVARDRMVAQAQNLEKAMKEFDAKWDKLSDLDDGLDERLKRAAEQYEKLLVDAARDAAKTEKQVREGFAGFVSKAVRGGLLLVDLGVVERVIKGATTAITATMDKTEERRLEIFALLSREEQVIHSFRDGRHLVAEFLEDHSYAMVKAAWGDGEDAAEAFTKKITLDGQKEDAAEFAKAAENEMQKVFSEAEKAYREFAKRHEHLFFGPLGSGYVQELSEIDTWKDKSRRWKDLREDFDDLLRERLLQIDDDDDRIFDVDMNGIVESDRRVIAKQLKEGCRNLLRAWNAWKDWNKEDPDFILENREQMQSILKALR